MPNHQQPLTAAALADVSAAELRAAIRSGQWAGPTAGLARGHVQANLVILPAAEAAEFAEFCRLNPRPCPLLPLPICAATCRAIAFFARGASKAMSQQTFSTCGATTWSAFCSAARSPSKTRWSAKD
jgi:uncharacterized protein YcsI (UPF0317 family)